MKTIMPICLFVLAIGTISCATDGTPNDKPGQGSDTSNVDSGVETDTHAVGTETPASDTSSTRDSDTDTLPPRIPVCVDIPLENDRSEISQEEYDSQLDLLNEAFALYLLAHPPTTEDTDSELTEPEVAVDAGTDIGDDAGVVDETLSLEKLEAFLDNWLTHITPISCAAFEKRDVMDQEIYKLYVDFYNPFDLTPLGYSPNPDRLADYQFIVVQTSIAIANAEMVWEGTPDSVVEDVRAGFHFDRKVNVLYLTPMYGALLDEFLRDIANQETAYWEAEKYLFLRERIPVIPAHWYGYHLLTHPEVDGAEIADNMNQATVNYRVTSQGGEATLERNGNVWEITSNRFTWIE